MFVNYCNSLKFAYNRGFERGHNTVSLTIHSFSLPIVSAHQIKGNNMRNITITDSLTASANKAQTIPTTNNKANIITPVLYGSPNPLTNKSSNLAAILKMPVIIPYITVANIIIEMEKA